MSPELRAEIVALFKELLTQEREKIRTRNRVRKHRAKKVLCNTDVTLGNVFPSRNVTPCNGSVTLKSPKSASVTLPSNGALHNSSGSPPTPPSPKNSTKNNSKKQYPTHEMVVERCKKLRFSDMIDFAWGKVRTGSYYGAPITDEEDFKGVMADILEKWKAAP